MPVRARKRRLTAALASAGAPLAPLGVLAEDFSRLVRVKRLVTWAREKVEPRPRLRH